MGRSKTLTDLEARLKVMTEERDDALESRDRYKAMVTALTAKKNALTEEVTQLRDQIAADATPRRGGRNGRRARGS